MSFAEIEQIRQEILPLREQARIQNGWLKERLDSLLGELMERAQVDLWLVVCREYNEDPVVMSLLPAPAMTVRRRTMLLFYRRPDGTVERLALDRYGYPGYYTAAWNPDEEPDQYACLARLIGERNPERIGINTSDYFAFGDGMSQQEHGRLTAALGADLMSRVVSADQLCVGWLERRIPAELETYAQIVRWGHALISTMYSRAVITPGVTETADVVWWMRQTLHDLGLEAWFQPSVSRQANGVSFRDADADPVIQAGDLLHCDVGFMYMGLATDQQQHSYVLNTGETSAPEGLQAALQKGNRLQAIHTAQMEVGKTGNQILAAVLQQAQTEGLGATVYSHPIGYHGHAAGPTIGLWDQQNGVVGNGDYPVFDHTCYSIELNVVHYLPEWEQDVRIALEEDGVLVNGRFEWLDGRQTMFHLI